MKERLPLADVASDIATRIGTLRGGSFTFWGIWFGRPYDNSHKAVSVEGGDNFLRFIFDGGERLTIWEPANYTFDASQFIVHSASRVLWEWFYYGRPHSPTDEMMYHDFRRTGLSIVFTSNFRSTESERPNSLAPAVEIH